MINVSLTESSFPSHFKSAHISPLLKKPTLNKNSMNDYWPVSNLSFLSKVLENVVVNQLNSHINSSNTSSQYQSPYKKYHATETALLKIQNDILASMDAGKVTALTLLDLSTAFDTIDHTILLRSPDDWFGVTGKALDWFKSYRTGRCWRIRLGDCLSYKADLKFGVSQGSVLGPVLFTLYNTPLNRMNSGHAIPHHLYATDSQLYVSFASGDSTSTLNGLQPCLGSIQSWMLMDKLEMNPDNTEFLLIGNKWQWSKYLSMFPIELYGVKTNPANLLRILGWFSTNILPSTHIYQQSVAHVFTICRICGIFAVTLTWIVQNYLQMLLRPVMSIIAIHFCIVSLTLTSYSFSMFRIDWPAWWQSLIHLLAVFHCFFPSICCQ